MKKLILVSFLLLNLFLINKVNADMSAGLIAGGRGWNYTTVTASSGSITTTPCEFGGVYLASGSQSSVGDYLVAYDSSGITNVTSRASFVDSARVTPALVFESSGTVTSGEVAASTAQPRRGGYEKNWNVSDETGTGIRMNNGLYVFKTTGNSGEAFIAVIKWRR